MQENSYSGVVPAWKVRLINRRAMRMDVQPHELDDVQQRIVMHVAAFSFDPAKSNGAAERTALTALIDRQLKAMARARTRYRQHLDQIRDTVRTGHQMRGTVPTNAAYVDRHDLILDVRLAVARLSPPEQAVCAALSQGRSLADIARELGCSWHAVRRVVANIQRRFRSMGLDGWLLG